MTADMIDRDGWVYAAFDRANRARIRALVTPELVGEHEADPNGIHSDDLQRVLSYFRRGPMGGKYVVVAVEPFVDYRIGVIDGARNYAVRVLSETYATEHAVLHAIFVQRLTDIGALP